MARRLWPVVVSAVAAIVGLHCRDGGGGGGDTGGEIDAEAARRDGTRRTRRSATSRR